jgi:hypothetical protein
VDEENDPRASLGKPFITANAFWQSPNRDNQQGPVTVMVKQVLMPSGHFKAGRAT